MYASENFPTKSALRKAIKAGDSIGIYSPGPFAGSETRTGETSVEGPWYPKPHTWYARVRLANGIIVKVLS